jgi:hypothetical protein
LSIEFADDASKQAQWRAFLKRNELDALPLPEVVAAACVVDAGVAQR